jgi:hypothetical protein
MKGTDRSQQRSLLPYVETTLAAGTDRRSQGLLQPDKVDSWHMFELWGRMLHPYMRANSPYNIRRLERSLSRSVENHRLGIQELQFAPDFGEGIVPSARDIFVRDTIVSHRREGAPDPRDRSPTTREEGPEAVAIGDTPYDTSAAGKVGIATIGVLCGGFTEASI